MHSSFGSRARSSLVALLLASSSLALHAQPVIVNFDNPAPPGAADSYVNGTFQGLNFGTSQWRWTPPWGADPTNALYFGASNATSRTFSFATPPRVLNSVNVYTTRAGTLTLSDGVNPTITRNVTVGSMQLVTTGWTQGSTTITVGCTCSWSLGVDDITHSPSGPADTTPPTVTMSAPAAGTIVTGPVALNATASDAGGIAGVQFLLDGVPLGAEDTFTPYTLSWDTTTTPNGLHLLSARARDTSNNTATSSPLVDVTVNNPVGSGFGYSLSFNGTGTNDVDRVKIRIDDPANSLAGPPADVGAADFTIEFWLNGNLSGNAAAAIPCGENDNWKLGNGVIDRDRYSQPRAFGISLGAGRIAFGVDGDPSGSTTICGTTNVLDNQWHHIAVQRRRSDGFMWLYVDGILQAQADGPNGDVSYPDNGVPGNFCGPGGNQPCTNSDPFMVIGAEKHDAGPQYPPYRGLFDELHISNVLRYTSNFSRPTRPFTPNPNSVALYHFDEGQADFAGDSSGAFGGPSDAEIRFTAAQTAPQWVTQTPFVAAPASQVGQWLSTYTWPVVGVHAHLLRNGQVLIFDGATDQNIGGSSARLWNPATGVFTAVPTTSDMFCAGHTMLADGRLLVNGGNVSSWVGLVDTNVFDPVTSTWSRVANMQYRRWYPTSLTMGDGRVLTLSGTQSSPGSTALIPEIYNPQTNAWSSLTSASFLLPLYPHMYNLPDGRVLVPATDEDPIPTYVLNVQTGTWSTVDPTVLQGGAAIMYEPGRVMKTGSASDVDIATQPSVRNTYVLDMNQASPSWRQTESMEFPRGLHNLTILPDGSAVVTGGGRTTDGVNEAQAVYQAELWSPVTEEWTTMAAATRPRLYHSTALLLPDGRVLSAGGGRFVGFSQNNQFNAEIFSPPYLFRGERPQIDSTPASAEHGSTFFVATDEAAEIDRVTLVSPGSVTHQVNMNQRFANLTFERTSGGLNVTLPANVNAVTAGYYMLFIINSRGVPSVASFMQVVRPTGTAPVPTTTSIAPTSASAGGAAFTLTVNGSNFVSGSVVRWNGTNRTTTLVNASQLTAAIAAADVATAGTANVTVFTPSPGGGTSNAQTFTITAPNPAPTTTGISPASALAGGAQFALTVNGTGFVNGASTVRVNGINRTTAFVSATQLTATVLPADIATAGSASIVVFTSPPGGGTSNAQSLTIDQPNPVPATTGIAPSSALAGDPGFTLTVNGSNFMSSSVVRWNGADRPTTFVSANELTASISAADVDSGGSPLITVFNPTPGGGTSNGQTFTVTAPNPAPTTTGIAPALVGAGGAQFNLTVNGTGFVNGASAVYVDGNARATAFVSAGQLTATVLASDISSVGSVSITVVTSAPGGGTSNAQTLAIEQPNPVPVTSGLAPSSATAGDAGFTLTVDGSDFIEGSIVRWNGANRSTTFVSASQLTAVIGASDITTAGSPLITVFTPAPGGGTSNAQTFTIDAVPNPVPTTTALVPAFAVAGGAGFTLTVNGTDFVSGSSVVRWNGAIRSTTFVSANQLTAAITQADIATAGGASVTVFTAAPGGGTSNAQSFTIAVPANPVPVLSGLTPRSVFVGSGPLVLTVNGSSFINGAVVRLNGADRATTFVSATQLTASLSAADVATLGAATVTVFNPAPVGGVSAGQSFLVAGLGGGFWDDFNRANNATIGNNWTEKYPNAFSIAGNEVTHIDTTSVDIDYHDAIVYRPSSEDRNDVEVSLEFRALQPTNAFPQVHARVQRATIAQADTLNDYLFFVDGFEAVPGRAIIARQQAVSGQFECYMLAIPFPSALQASERYRLRFRVTGTVPVTLQGTVERYNGAGWDLFATGTVSHDATGTNPVRDPSLYCDAGTLPGPLTSGGATGFAKWRTNNEVIDNFYAIDLATTVGNPTPVTASLSPASTVAGGANFTLTVNGSAFVNGAVVRWNGADRPTTFVSAAQLTAAIPAVDIAAAGTASIAVFNPAPGGGLSNAQTLTITQSGGGMAGLVAAYNFNENAGTAVADSSGNGNVGTTANTTWTTSGRTGAALTFNGTSSWVTVADSASLDLTTGMTLEAWVYPTVQPTGWRTIIAKERAGGAAYFLHGGSSSQNRPATGVYASNAERQLLGGNRLTANTWVHLAATYDGVNQRLYVNGVQVATRAQTGAIAVSTNALRIGGNSVWGEYFQGRIDDVRVYNRALSQAEIATDMSTAVP